MCILIKRHKKKALCERAFKTTNFFSITTSKDSQFLEVCKKPILTPLRSLIKTWIEIGPYNLSSDIISVGVFELSPDSLLTLGEHFRGPSGAGQKNH